MCTSRFPALTRCGCACASSPCPSVPRRVGWSAIRGSGTQNSSKTGYLAPGAFQGNRERSGSRIEFLKYFARALCSHDRVSTSVAVWPTAIGGASHVIRAVWPPSAAATLGSRSSRCTIRRAAAIPPSSAAPAAGQDPTRPRLNRSIQSAAVPAGRWPHVVWRAAAARGGRPTPNGCRTRFGGIGGCPSSRRADLVPVAPCGELPGGRGGRRRATSDPLGDLRCVVVGAARVMRHGSSWRDRVIFHFSFFSTPFPFYKAHAIPTTL